MYSTYMYTYTKYINQSRSYKEDSTKIKIMAVVLLDDAVHPSYEKRLFVLSLNQICLSTTSRKNCRSQSRTSFIKSNHVVHYIAIQFFYGTARRKEANEKAIGRYQYQCNAIEGTEKQRFRFVRRLPPRLNFVSKCMRAPADSNSRYILTTGNDGFGNFSFHSNTELGEMHINVSM